MQGKGAWLAALSACAVVSLAGCASSWRQARFERDVEVAFPISAGTGVSATTDNGGVRMTEVARNDVLVRAHIRATSQERADAVEIVGHDDSGWLEVRVVWPPQRGPGEGVSFEIDGPGGRPVRADTGNGGVRVTGFAGGATLRTSNGEVWVERHVGPIDAGTSNGRITLLDATGEVLADTSNGEARVELADAGVGPVHIETSNGGVTLVVGPGFAGQIEADTSNGSVRTGGGRMGAVSGSRTHKVVRVGDGGAGSSITTSNGSIEIGSRD